MTHQYETSLSAAEIIDRAKTFFAERVPNQAAYPEKEGPGFVTLRGQGGEEIALGISAAGSGSRSRLRPIGDSGCGRCVRRGRRAGAGGCRRDERSR